MERKCPQCGAPIDLEAKECKYCGEKLAVQQINNEMQGSGKEKSKVVAGLLALFLGSLGIHKFYLGYKKEGLIMLLVTLIGSILCGAGIAVMSVIALIEGIVYFTKSDAEFEDTYVKGYKGWF